MLRFLLLALMLPLPAAAQSDILAPLTNVTFDLVAPSGIDVSSPRMTVILGSAFSSETLRLSLAQTDAPAGVTHRFVIQDSQRADLDRFQTRNPHVLLAQPAIPLCRTGAPLGDGSMSYRIALPGHGPTSGRTFSPERLPRLAAKMRPCPAQRTH